MKLLTWTIFFLMPIAYVVIYLVLTYVFSKTKPTIKQLLVDASIALMGFIIIHYLVNFFLWSPLTGIVTVPFDILIEEFDLNSVLFFITGLVIVIGIIPSLVLFTKKFLYQKLSFSTGKYYYLTGIIFSMIAYFLPLYGYITYLMWTTYHCLFCYFVNL